MQLRAILSVAMSSVPVGSWCEVERVAQVDDFSTNSSSSL
jgi:hypothetical protein